ncbi:hypothetical protein ACFLSE_08700 [Bacteroidota bacterium]
MKSEFEKKKIKYDHRSKNGYFYNDPNDKNVYVPSWRFGKWAVNIGHPQFRKFLLFFVIIVIAGILIFELINLIL